MANQKGFSFKISGEVFVPQKSNSGTDMVAAFTAACDAHAAILISLEGIPAQIEITKPVQITRRVPYDPNNAEPPLPITDDKAGVKPDKA